MTWLDEILGTATALEAARACDLRVAGRAFGPCPACGAEQRSDSDRRPPVGTFVSDSGRVLARCFRCELAFDAIAVVSYAATGEPLSKANHREVRAFAADRGLCCPSDAGPSAAAPRLHRLAEAELAAPPRPSSDELRALAAQAVPVTREPEVALWCESRGCDPVKVEELKLAAALPETATLPPWARLGLRNWVQSGHRAIFAALGVSARVESVRARAIVSGARPKTAAPRGCSARGLVLANGTARALLRGEPKARAQVRELGVSIHEGEPSWLAAAIAAGAEGPAVFGVTAGAWSKDFAATIPERAPIRVATHDDAAGRLYADAIRGTLGDRCEVLVALEQNA